MIKNISDMQSTLVKHDAQNWVKSLDIGSLKEGQNSANNPKLDSFMSFLKDSMVEVDQLQQKANVEMQKLASGESQNLHEALLSMERADIAFKTMNQIRSKVLDAYKEIMKIQV